MILEYNDTTNNRTIATLRDQQGAKKFELLMFPLSFYSRRLDDMQDPYVPYTLEMYFHQEQCSHQLIEEHDTVNSFFIEALNTLITDTPFKSIFFTVDEVLYNYYWVNVVPHLTSLTATSTSIFNDDMTREKVSHWPNFIERFGHKKLTCMIKNQDITTYTGTWWDTTKSIKG